MVRFYYIIKSVLQKAQHSLTLPSYIPKREMPHCFNDKTLIYVCIELIWLAWPKGKVGYKIDSYCYCLICCDELVVSFNEGESNTRVVSNVQFKRLAPNSFNLPQEMGHKRKLNSIHQSLEEITIGSITHLNKPGLMSLASLYYCLIDGNIDVYFDVRTRENHFNLSN